MTKENDMTKMMREFAEQLQRLHASCLRAQLRLEKHLAIPSRPVLGVPTRMNELMTVWRQMLRPGGVEKYLLGRGFDRVVVSVAVGGDHE